MFFQNPGWLREWIEKYPGKANKIWPYWAAARSDTIRRWPDPLEALVREGRNPPVFWANIMLGIPGETPEDAFKTMRMLKRMKRFFPSICTCSRSRTARKS
jgi:hypothetical protein